MSNNLFMHLTRFGDVAVCYEHSREELSGCVTENTVVLGVVTSRGHDVYTELNDDEKIELVEAIVMREESTRCLSTNEHPCPYREEINGDSETLCTCNAEQTAQCADDV